VSHKESTYSGQKEATAKAPTKPLSVIDATLGLLVSFLPTELMQELPSSAAEATLPTVHTHLVSVELVRSYIHREVRQDLK